MKTLSNPRSNTCASKRRPALNVSSKDIKEYHDQHQPAKFRKLPSHIKENQGHVQFFAKFQESALMEHPDSAHKSINLFKTQKKFEKILRNIEPRGGTFYRFGFKSFEKTNQKLFAQVLNIIPSRMKGTMHIGEMWTNVQTKKFLRQNKIYINKLKLIDKLKQAKEQQEKQLIQSTATLLPPPSDPLARISLNSRFLLTQPNNARLQTSEGSINSFKELNRSIEQIHKRIRSLKPFASTERNVQKFKKMEEYIDRMGEIDSHYHAQIAEWI